MHPADKVSPRLHHQAIGVVTQPGRNAQSYAGPFVGGTLGIAMYHQHTVIEPDLTLCEAGLTESSTCNDFIHIRTVISLQKRLDRIQIAIAPRPEVQSSYRLLNLHCTGLARLHRYLLTIEFSYLPAFCIQHLGHK